MDDSLPGSERAKAKHDYRANGGEPVILNYICNEPEDGKAGKEGCQNREGNKRR
jgi:hypothetical protein